jgi:hypothetical protein
VDVSDPAYKEMVFRNSNSTDFRDCVKTRIAVAFLFVLVRVISWIGYYVPQKKRSTKSHELTLTKPHGTLEFLTQSLPLVGFSEF